MLASAARADEARTHSTLVLVVLALAAMAYSMLSSAVVPALPAIQHAVGASETGIAWLLTGYLLAAGMYSSFIVLPQFAQLPRSTGFGFGASVLVSGLYLLPSTAGMFVMGVLAGGISGRFGARFSLIVGTAVTAAAFLLLSLAHGAPIDFLTAALLLGIGIGLAFAALGNLVISAVPPNQSGVASGMNTVLRTLGGALGGQLSATFIAGHVAHGLPALTGFTQTFVMATGFLVVGVGASFLVPRRQTTGATASGGDRPAAHTTADTATHPTAHTTGEPPVQTSRVQ